jgi:hypothetical protein
MTGYYGRDVRIDEISGLSGLIDAFGRLRISDPQTIFDSKQVFDDGDIANSAENAPQFYDNQETSGGGTSTAFDVNAASTTLSVSADTAGTRVRQSKRRMNYQPGKSQLIKLTSVFGAAASGITRRYGLFDENNGLFLQQTGTELSLVIRSNVTGSPVDTAVAQADWNIDTMGGGDGTLGASGITLDMSKSQIFVIDFEWLGVGSVRFGFEIDEVLYYVHQANHANRISGVYMSTPNLPVRAEIANDGTGAAAGFEMICAEVASEGGVEPQGVSRGYDTGDTPVALATAGVAYAVMGLRLRSSHLGLEVDLTNLDMLIPSAADDVIWRLYLNPTLSAPLTYANIPHSGLQGATGTGSITLSAVGEKILCGTATSTDTISVPANIAQKLGSLIDGTPDELVLVVTPLTNSTTIVAAANWRELL